MKRPISHYLLIMGLTLKLAGLVGAVVIAGPDLDSGPTVVSAQEKAPADKPEKDAEAKPEAAEEAKAKDAKAQDETAAGQQAAEHPDGFDPRLIRLLEIKEQKLAQEEERLAREREELLKLREEVNRRIGELQKVQDVLGKLVTAERKQREEKVMQLVKVLTNMRAPAAAAVVAKLDDPMAVDIFTRMQSRAAGKVMAELEPEQAARIGVLLTKQKQAAEAARVAAEAAAKGAQPPPAREGEAPPDKKKE
jgi:flagellar motility protein MotE (MotC chaperone)